ncbi:hypothetical protein Zmor_010866 [Zophobas morio]|uniref:Uncharacterized protein n=1 Tax=Zophobas morio TaxID=2755281 RepID=A0AA38IL22_9CUCU|nr:hypothetical protein Zmor_010866 [Zophobas morio]
MDRRELSSKCGDDGSSSVTVGRRHSTSLEVTGSLDCGTQKNVEAAFSIHRKERIGLTRGHRRERNYSAKFSPDEFNECRENPVKLRRNYFVHNRSVISRVNSSY